MISRRGFIRGLGAIAAAPAVSIDTPAALAAPRATSPAWPAHDDPRYWAKIRQQFDLESDEVFFNTATLGAPARVVNDAVVASTRKLTSTLAEWSYKPDTPNWIAGYSAEDSLRKKLAALIHAADHQELALTQNATMGLSFVAAGLELVDGDEIIQTDQEHIGAKSCWELLQKRRSVVWKTVALPVPANDPEEIVRLVTAAITPRTRVIAWPHITSQLGTVHPVREICALARGRGIFTVIDGAQAIGQIPVDVQAIGCDAYAGSPHKWLLAPAGNGFLYLRRDAAPKVWTTIASGEWANDKDPGLRLQQRGTGSLPLLAGLDAAIEFHLRVGPERWFARIKALGDHLRARLRDVPGAVVASSTHPAMCAGMTTWKLGQHPPYEMVDRIWERARIRPRAVSPVWGMRTSTMIYNSEAEIDRLIAAALAVAKGATG
jgi:selenocysteine lyase/cysteine desulfurase